MWVTGHNEGALKPVCNSNTFAVPTQVAPILFGLTCQGLDEGLGSVVSVPFLCNTTFAS